MKGKWEERINIKVVRIGLFSGISMLENIQVEEIEILKLLFHIKGGWMLSGRPFENYLASSFDWLSIDHTISNFVGIEVILWKTNSNANYSCPYQCKFAICPRGKIGFHPIDKLIPLKFIVLMDFNKFDISKCISAFLIVCSYVCEFFKSSYE